MRKWSLSGDGDMSLWVETYQKQGSKETFTRFNHGHTTLSVMDVTESPRTELEYEMNIHCNCVFDDKMNDDLKSSDQNSNLSFTSTNYI